MSLLANMVAVSAALLGETPQDACGTLQLAVVDPVTGRSAPFRIHLKDENGAPVLLPDEVCWHGHMTCAGSVQWTLPAGAYHYIIERGPEFARFEGNIDIKPTGIVERKVTLMRIADCAKEGWWCGDLHVHRPVDAMPLLMDAEDLHVAPVITWWNAASPWNTLPLPENPLVCCRAHRCYHLLAGEDERRGGAFMFFNLRAPIDITQAESEYPSPLAFCEIARKEGAWIELEKPFWWDAPVALAHGLVDSVGLAHNHLQREGMLDNEAWGRPRDRNTYPSPLGNGYWSQDIYYHMLNVGFRIPPSAGSASGVLATPLGYNRVYVHLDGGFSHTQWWAGLRAGRCFVTNGPLLRVQCEGHRAGHVFQYDEGKTIELTPVFRLTAREPVTRIEVIKNGAVESIIESPPTGARTALPPLRFKGSGWFLVRAIGANKETFRFASTAPFYVEMGENPRRISHRSAAFFLTWVEERLANIELPPGPQRDEVVAYHEQARAFWRERMANANAE